MITILFFYAIVIHSNANPPVIESKKRLYRIIDTGKTIPLQNIVSAEYAISIRIQQTEETLNQVMKEVYQFILPSDVQFSITNNYINPERVIQIRTVTISDKAIDQITTSLYSIAGVMAVNVFKL